MVSILRAYGIPEQLVDAIGKMYENTRAKVTSPDGETDLFELLAGVLQGDTLAPYLFVIVLDYALRTTIDGREEELRFHLQRRKSRRLAQKLSQTLTLLMILPFSLKRLSKLKSYLAE